jgi:hypothetical protein
MEQITTRRAFVLVLLFDEEEDVFFTVVVETRISVKLHANLFALSTSSHDQKLIQHLSK